MQYSELSEDVRVFYFYIPLLMHKGMEIEEQKKGEAVEGADDL